MKYTHLIRRVAMTPWAIVPEKLCEIVEFLEFAASGGKFSNEEVEARISPKRERETADARGDVLVIPMVGVVSQRGGNMEDVSAPMGVSTERLSRQLRSAIEEPKIKAIVLDVDSPGGTVSGVDELASEVFSLRGTKPIVAVANSMTASAAYWIATAADELVVTPGGSVGSVGVFAAHMDYSGHLEQYGFKPTLISAGKFKAEGHPWIPLSEDAKAHIQEDVDHYYSMFIKAIARNRNVAQKEVREGFGQGRMVSADQAVKLGMADRVATLRETVERFGASTSPNSSRRASTPFARMSRHLKMIQQ